MKRKAQEEMVGFVLIIVIVAVLLVIFIGFSLKTNQKEDVESYEVGSFLRASLQYTTDCENNLGYLAIDKLIEGCINKNRCIDERDMCLVLTQKINELVDVSWQIENRPIMGYKLEILSEGKEIIPTINKGNSTNNYKNGFEESGTGSSIIFRVYY